MSRPEKHVVETAGYGEPRDGESWCSCGWMSDNDLFGTFGAHHYINENRAYWQYLEDFYNTNKGAR